MIEILASATNMKRVADNAARMADVDPHGWTLTLVSVSVVFGALIILFLAYSLSGAVFTGKVRNALRKLRFRKAPGDEESAAIAVALDDYLSGGSDAEEVAAIAAALAIYTGEDETHDIESGIITIKR